MSYLARLRAKIQEKPTHEQLTKPTKAKCFGSVSFVSALRSRFWAAALDETEFEERKAMAMGGVPEAYLDGWARLQCQRPTATPENEWRQAINDAGLFADRLGTLAVEFQWKPSDLFNPPTDGRPGGLVWRIKGKGVRSLGYGCAVTTEGRGI